MSNEKTINFGGEDFGGVEINQTVATHTAGSVESDVQAGIEFIYHMREHLVDIGIATVYALTIYAIILWLQRKFKN